MENALELVLFKKKKVSSSKETLGWIQKSVLEHYIDDLVMPEHNKKVCSLDQS
jgi:hypothetical protein